jgi:hypothetical protein
MASFVLSILYNITGLYFAVQGNLHPLIAAILMPSSSPQHFIGNLREQQPGGTFHEIMTYPKPTLSI